MPKRFKKLENFSNGTPLLGKAFGVSPDAFGTGSNEYYIFGFSNKKDRPVPARWKWKVGNAAPTGPKDLGTIVVPSSLPAVKKPGGVAIASRANGTSWVGSGKSVNDYRVDCSEAFLQKDDSPNPKPMKGLGHLDDQSNSAAKAVSKDASVIAGRAWSGTNQCDAVVFSGGGYLWRLPHLSGGRDVSVACGVSANGKRIVGKSDSSRGTEAVFWHERRKRWTRPRSLHKKSDKNVFGKALDVSVDGKVIVGQVWDENAKKFVAFHWKGGNMALHTDTSRARAVAVHSGTTTIVGEMGVGNAEEAFIWTVGVGVKSLQTELGTVVSNEWKLRQAHAISNDGNVIVGVGEQTIGGITTTHGWIASLT
jgi:uncharacterized membrane protein